MAYERVNWENLPSTKTPINQTNLTKIENGIDQAGAEIFVGAEEPTAGKKVWFRKGKNVFNAYSSNISYYLRFTDKEKYIINNSNSITVEGNDVAWNRVEITISNLKANTKYTINSIVTNTTQRDAGLLCDYGNNSVLDVNNKEKFNAKITIVTDENGKVKLQFYTNHSSTKQKGSAIFSEIQLEQGSKATSYEAYIEPQIFVKNSNGEYEEFTKNYKKLIGEASTNSSGLMSKNDKSKLDNIFNSIYPVGSVYISVNSTNPSTLFGGTWERIARGRTLVGEGIVEDNNDNWCGKTKKGDWAAYAGKMGGEVTHTLTLNELPNSVWHSADQDGGVQKMFNEGVAFGIKTQGNNMNKAHNNLPPYLVVYIWKRTA